MITASVVLYNSNRDEINQVLDCACCNSIEKVWVIDNSPYDDLSCCASISPKIEYIFGHGNIGYGAAHNLAIKKAIEQGSKYHVVINPDIKFQDGTIEQLASYMDKNHDVGQVMPRIVYPNGDLQYLCKLLPSPIDLFGRRFIPIKSIVKKRNDRYEMKGSGYNKTINVPFLSGCFMFLRVEALAKVDGFDDDFFMYCEDIDLCRRISMIGYKTVYLPDVTIVHAHKKESFKNKAMLKAHIKSAIRYFNKWGWIFDRYRAQINKEATKQYE